jgi:hypothetical protein
MKTVLIKRGDTKGKFIDTLTLDGVPINLTGCTVKFLLRRRGRDKEQLTINQVAVITDQPEGKVEYQPVAADVEVEGLYDHEWQVTFPSAEILTVPNSGFNTVEILRDLGN